MNYVQSGFRMPEPEGIGEKKKMYAEILAVCRCGIEICVSLRSI